MYSSMWFMSIVALLVVDVRTGAMQQAETQPHRCHQCSPTNTTSCQLSEIGWLTATCPSARPFCATVALAPDFASSLGCAAQAATSPCSLTNSPRQTLELTCICVGHLCNAPFTDILRTELFNFSSLSGNDSTLTEAFFNLSNFANVSESALYKTIVLAGDGNSTEMTLTSEADGSLSMPHAEALQQQTAPSEDDEDESEGSGAYEESSSHVHQPASAPAAPSSLLPSEENKACFLTTNLLIPLSLLYIIL